MPSIARLALLILLAFPASAAMAQTGFRLVMVEAQHCIYCRVFNRDMAPIYARSPEGQIAPLVHVQLGGPYPEGVTFTSRPGMTPTFILIGPDGTEIDRLIGYPGEDFFWGYLDRMFARAGIDPGASGG
jgi:hypothetical protein